MQVGLCESLRSIHIFTTGCRSNMQSQGIPTITCTQSISFQICIQSGLRQLPLQWAIGMRLCNIMIMISIMFAVTELWCTTEAGNKVAPRSKFGQQQAAKKQKEGIVDNTILKEAGQCLWFPSPTSSGNSH